MPENLDFIGKIYIKKARRYNKTYLSPVVVKLPRKINPNIDNLLYLNGKKVIISLKFPKSQT